MEEAQVPCSERMMLTIRQTDFLAFFFCDERRQKPAEIRGGNIIQRDRRPIIAAVTERAAHRR
jgi:hypothetical protein